LERTEDNASGAPTVHGDASRIPCTRKEFQVSKQLKGRRIAVLATDGFEKVELSVPAAALRAAGAEVDIVSLKSGAIRGVNLHKPANKVQVTKTVKEANPADYDGLLVPGGFINPDMLRQSAEARDFVRAFDAANKPIATLCHGPWVLASAGLLDGRVLTSWPGVRDDLVNAGAKWLDQQVVWDGNLVTSRGPQDIVPFVRALKTHFAPGASLDKRTRALHSAPQHDQPPKAVLGVMRVFPLPKFKALLTVGAIAAGVYALKNSGANREVQREFSRAS
jgi:protease I